MSTDETNIQLLIGTVIIIIIIIIIIIEIVLEAHKHIHTCKIEKKRKKHTQSKHTNKVDQHQLVQRI